MPRKMTQGEIARGLANAPLPVVARCRCVWWIIVPKDLGSECKACGQLILTSSGSPPKRTRETMARLLAAASA